MRKGRRRLVLLAAILTLLASLAAILSLTTSGLKLVDSTSHAVGGDLGSKVGEAPLKDVSRKPEFKSEKPLFVSIDIGSGKGRFVIGVLDESQGTGKGYDRFYLDANNNGDLTDDAEPDAKIQSSGRVTLVLLDRADVTVRYEDGGERELAIDLAVHGISRSGGRIKWQVRYTILQHLEGQLDLGGKKVTVGFYDRQSRRHQVNGCFSDFGSDRMRLDVNGDGILAADEDTPLSRVFVYGGRMWELKLGVSAAGASAKPFEGKTGQLKIDCTYAEGAEVTGGRMVFYSKDGYALTHAPKGWEPASLPAGTFQLDEAWLDLTDKAGGKWRLHLTGSKPFEVTPGGTTELKLGLPVRVEPVVTGQTSPGGSVSILRKLVGTAGEVYDSIAKRGGKRVKPPEVTVLDSGGARVTSASMKYGCGGYCGYSWKVPSDLEFGMDGTAKFKVRIDAYTGPVAGKLSGTVELTVNKP